MAQERTVIVNKPHPLTEHICTLAVVVLSFLLAPAASVLVALAVAFLLDVDTLTTIKQGAALGLLMAGFITVAQLAHYLAPLRPLFAGVTLIGLRLLMLGIRVPTPTPAMPAILPPPMRPQVTGMRIVPGVGVQYDRTDDWGNHLADSDEMVDEDTDDEPPADHVIVDTDMDEDMMTLARRFRQGKSAWSRKTMMHEGWTRSQWDAATRKLVECGVLLPDKSAPMAGYGQLVRE